MLKTLAIAGLASTVLAAPFTFPLANGFPKPNATALAQIQKEAGGTLPNTPLPTGLGPASIVALQLVAANEIFEVAYFSQLLHNITTNVPGYECTEEDRKFVTGAVHRIRAQEQLHALGANAILAANNATTVNPCQYQFPVSDFQSAIKLANTFTDVVLGVLPQVQLSNTSLVQLVGAIEEQEAEQVGWFRVLQQKFPSAAPFLAPTTPEFALSAIKMFFVPGTCGPEYAAVESKIKSFPPLTVTSPPTTQKQTASYSVQGTISASNAIAYISGQNKPVTVAITNIKSSYGSTTFDAVFPAEAQGFADGLTVATVVGSNTAFNNGTQVAANTLFGPGLIEYN